MIYEQERGILMAEKYANELENILIKLGEDENELFKLKELFKLEFPNTWARKYYVCLKEKEKFINSLY